MMPITIKNVTGSDMTRANSRQSLLQYATQGRRVPPKVKARAKDKLPTKVRYLTPTFSRAGWENGYYSLINYRANSLSI